MTASARSVRFGEEEIQRLFGHEAAENEDPDRLKQYYFKSKPYGRIMADLPLRVLVGHKGIGKSALFQIAMKEDQESGKLAIAVKPDDVDLVAKEHTDLNDSIRQWKAGLRKIIQERVLAGWDVKVPSGAINRVGGLVLGLTHTLSPLLKDKVDLEPVRKAAAAKFCSTRSIRVYLDDLDRGWSGSKHHIERLSALLNAARDMSTDEPGLQFRLALRSDVYYLVRTSDESTDKVEGSVIWYSWTNHEILAMLAKRVTTFFGQSFSEDSLLRRTQPELAGMLSRVMEDRFAGRGKWKDAPTYRVLMSVIRRRPRDLVKFLTLAARQAADRGHSRIGTADFQAVFSEYSQGRIQDTVNEYRSELPEIEKLLLGMRPTSAEKRSTGGFVYTTDKLVQKIGRIREHVHFRNAHGQEVDATWLAAFLYKINFINARKVLESTYIDRKYFDENRYLSGHFADFGYDWEIHPAYWWALQPEDDKPFYERAIQMDDSSN